MSLADALLLDPYPLNVYIAQRHDGAKGSGTINDPWDGSTAAKFDAIMADLPLDEDGNATVQVNLGPGEFQTKGYSDEDYADEEETDRWRVLPMIKIVGCGVDLTTVKLVGSFTAGRHYFAFA